MRRQREIWSIVGVLILLAIGFLFVFWEGETVQLRALDRVDVIRTLDNPNDVVVSLEPGQRVEVIACEDTKSDVAVRVRLSPHQDGYVIRGSFKLERRAASAASLFDPGNLVFSCKGMFTSISEFQQGS